MSKLRSAAEVAEEVATRTWGDGLNHTGYEHLKARLCRFFEARDDAVAQVCADAARAVLAQYALKDAWGISQAMETAILHAINPPETERERLGRVLWEATCPGGEMGDLTPMERNIFCDHAAAVQDELRKIDKEASGE